MKRLVPILLAACAYTAPDNPYANTIGNGITGSVVVDGLEVTGPVIVLLVDAANPMPPAGTGRPVSFSTVPASAFTDGTSGLRAAPWALTNVPDGDWLLTALMDNDGNFHPSVPTLGGTTCLDLAGAHLASLSGREPAVVSVRGGQLVHDVTILLAATVPTSPPVFTLQQADTIDLTSPLPVVQLVSSPVDAAYGEGLSLVVPPPGDPPNPCAAFMTVHVRDLDLDGLPDPHPDYPPETGVADVWPRVYLEWLGEPLDTDADGVSDAFDRGDATARYVTEGLPYTPQLLGGAPEDLARIGAPFAATTLDVAWSGAVQELMADGTTNLLTDPAAVPRGAWSVTLIAETGQTWTVPNELDTALQLSRSLPEPGVTSPRDPAQGRWILIP